MIRSHLVSRDDSDWIDVVPGVTLMYNEMEQGEYGYSASQKMWGQVMNLHTNLLHGTSSMGESEKHQFVQNLGRELWEVWEKVAPFNRNKQKVAKNPFKEGEFILVHQQPMERMHKLSPRWRGPYEVTKVINPFQLQYQDEGKQKITHVRNCKKFRCLVNGGNEWVPGMGEGLMCVRSQCQVRRQREMTCYVVEVLDAGSKWTLNNASHFCKWLWERKGNPADLYVLGVPARGGRGSREVAQCLSKQLWLPNPLHQWQKRKVEYLLNCCGHCSEKEGAVCEAQPLEPLTRDREAPTPLDPWTKNSVVAILNNGAAIWCDETAIMCSEHSTAGPDLTSVTSSDQGCIRRATPEPGSIRELLLQRPDLLDLRRVQQQQPTGTLRLSPVEKEAIR